MTLSLLDDRVEAFRVFAEELNFTRAALRLHISQPALHVKISNLSKALGRALYVRRGNTLVLTAAGVALRDAATDLRAQEDRHLAALGLGREQPVTIAAGEGAYLHLLARAVQLLQKGRVGIRLLTRDQKATCSAVCEGQADIGFAVFNGMPKELVTHCEVAVPIVLAVPCEHPLAGFARCDVSQLRDVPLIVPPRGRPHRQRVEDAFARARVPISVAMDVEGWELMLTFVAAGLGAALVNGSLAPREGLVLRPFDGLDGVTYSLVTRVGADESEGVKAVLGVLSRVLSSKAAQLSAAYDK